jgi:hypothetical protein
MLSKGRLSWRQRDTIDWETVRSSMGSSPWIRGTPQRKFSRATRVIKQPTSFETLGRPPRQRPVTDIPQNADPLRRPRKTVCGWTVKGFRARQSQQSDGKLKHLIPSAEAEFRCAVVRQFDRAARHFPSPALCGFGVGFARPKPIRCSASF